MRAKSSILFLCLLAAFAGAALAQTPDGQTPAVETDCDLESGAAFGLCNAYCEAMDCDCDGIVCTANASSTACTKVADNFNKKTGRTISCGIVCPCFDAANWGGDGTWNLVVSNAEGCSGGNTLAFITSPITAWATVFEDTDGDAQDDSTCTWGDGTDGNNTQATLAITAQQAAACKADLAAACP